MSKIILPVLCVYKLVTILPVLRHDTKANKGKLIKADISLECIEHKDGEAYCRELDKRFTKIAYLMPKILNPKNLQHFLPNGVIIATPVFADFLPDREIKIPVNLVEISDLNDITVAVINPVMTDTPPEDFSGAEPQPPAPFTIYQDPPLATDTPMDSAPTSPASTMSMSTLDASTIFEAGHIPVPGGTQMVLRPREGQRELGFDPMSTSTKSPEKKKSPSIYDDPVPGTSSAKTASMPPTKPKTPRKSPRKELKRTASQPAIDMFQKNQRRTVLRLPSPIPGDIPTSGSKKPRSPSSPEEQNAAKYKLILSDLTAEEREVTRNLEDKLMREDSAIKEATVNPDTVRLIGGSQARP